MVGGIVALELAITGLTTLVAIGLVEKQQLD